MGFMILGAVIIGIALIITISGIMVIDIVDIVFLGLETFFFSFLALRPYSPVINGNSFMNPGDEQIFLPWYQGVVKKASGFNLPLINSLVIAIIIAVAVIALLVIFEFKLSWRISYAFALIKYPAGIFASWLFTDNMRTMEGASKNVRTIALIVLVLIHILVFLVNDIKYVRNVGNERLKHQNYRDNLRVYKVFRKRYKNEAKMRARAEKAKGQTAGE